MAFSQYYTASSNMLLILTHVVWSYRTRVAKGASPCRALPFAFVRARDVGCGRVRIRFSSALRGTPRGSDTPPSLKTTSQSDTSVSMPDKRTVLGRPGVYNPLLIRKNGSDKKIFHFLENFFGQFALIFVSAFVAKFEPRVLRDDSSADWVQNNRLNPLHAHSTVEVLYTHRHAHDSEFYFAFAICDMQQILQRSDKVFATTTSVQPQQE